MADEPRAISSGKQRGRPFAPGQSGNPKGRARGSRNRLSQIGEGILAREGTALLEKAVELAKGGDVPCLRLLIERIAPQARSARFVVLDLPALRTPADLVTAAAMITEQVASGKLALDDIGPLVSLIESSIEAIRTDDHDQRIASLESFVANRRLRAAG
jgi:hypothetical protein